jgi:ABC-type xylose transport system permease subunit
MKLPAVDSPADFVTGIILLLFFVLLIAVAIPAEVPTPPQQKFSAVSPALLPYALGLIGVLFSGLLLAGAASPDRSTAAVDGNQYLPWPESAPRLTIVVSVALLYFVLFQRLGALPTSVLAMLVLLTVGGMRPWYRLVVYSVVLPAVVYAIFVWLVRVPLPRGIFPF